jgi:hypothetical protein
MHRCIIMGKIPPATDKQKKYMRDMGEDPSEYRDTVVEAHKVLDSLESGGISNSIANDLRKTRKWLEDDI